METTLWLIGIHLTELLILGIVLIVRKNMKLSRVIETQQEYISTLEYQFSQMNTALGSLEKKMHVDGDEEITDVFSNMKDIQDSIHNMYN